VGSDCVGFQTAGTVRFPRYTHPQVAIAYSFDSFVASHPGGPSNTTLQYFKSSYTDQVEATFTPLFRANVDTAIVDIGHENLAGYKLVVVPADYLMDPASARAIRDYVSAGGTVLMTAYSAKLDAHGNWFDSPLPGLLSDVFGLRTSAFYEVQQPLRVELEGRAVDTHVRTYEVLEPSTARVIARFLNTTDHSPAVTVNRFGKGRAIYLAMESTASAIGPVLESFFRDAGVRPGPKTPPAFMRAWSKAECSA
jgi:beta-galactosidase